MKYLITESQYRKLLLEDSPNPYVGKKSTEGNFTITKFTTNNDSKSPLKLYPSNRYPIHIILRNRNVEQKEIIIEAVQFSDENRVSDLSYTQKPIPYSQGGQIYFNLIPSNNTSSEAFGNLSIDIVCFVLRKNVRDYLTLNYTYTVFPSEKRYEGCKSIFDQNALKRATDWYKNWLSNQATKNKFAKIFNYDTKTVEKHFENYLKILD